MSNGGKRHAKIHGSGDHDTTVEVTSHHAKHENAGADKISVAGLSGELADDQPVKSHGATKHDTSVLDTVIKMVAAQFCRIHTGQYTGDGTTSHAITGIGFRPKYLYIWRHYDAPSDHYRWFAAVDVAGNDFAYEMYEAVRFGSYYDRVESLDADGFTVDSILGTYDPNVSGVVYDFMTIG